MEESDWLTERAQVTSPELEFCSLELVSFSYVLAVLLTIRVYITANSITLIILIRTFECE